MVEGIVAFIDFIGSHWIDCAHGRDVKSCDDSDRTSNELDATDGGAGTRKEGIKEWRKVRNYSSRFGKVSALAISKLFNGNL